MTVADISVGLSSLRTALAMAIDMQDLDGVEALRDRNTELRAVLVEALNKANQFREAYQTQADHIRRLECEIERRAPSQHSTLDQRSNVTPLTYHDRGTSGTQLDVMSGTVVVCTLRKAMMSTDTRGERWEWTWRISSGPPGFTIHGSADTKHAAQQVLARVGNRAGTTMTDQSRQNYLRPHRGRLILTLGVLSFVIAGVLTGIPAWVMGSGDLKKMDAGIMDPEGRALTMAGRILGKVCTILTIVILAIALVAIAFHTASGAT